MGIAYTESRDPANLPMAKEIVEVLTFAYPNHSWWVRIDGGVVIIKHFGISGTVGMVRKYDALASDAMARKRDVIRAAGELLERAGLRRGAYDGQAVTDLEHDKDVAWKAQINPDTRVIHGDRADEPSL